MDKKMISGSVLTLCALLTTPTMAADQRGQSIMFQNQEDVQTSDPLGSTHTPMDALKQNDDHCTELLKEIDRLQGKPQRRHAARQRYDEECRSTTP